jgi:hypothetical protein
METQASTAHVTLGKGIDPAKLERELNAMWSEMSAPGAGAGVVRACVLNLVVYAEGPRERAEVDDLLAEVVERHPCRAIVLNAERGDAESRLEAFVSTRCQLSSRASRAWPTASSSTRPPSTGRTKTCAAWPPCSGAGGCA